METTASIPTTFCTTLKDHQVLIVCGPNTPQQINFILSLYNCHFIFIVLFYLVSLFNMYMFIVLDSAGMYVACALCL